MEQRPLKDQLAHFGRAFALMLNRALMYQVSHPFVQESIQDVIRMAELILFRISPLVFILNREEFYVDEEALDSRINVKRTVGLFKTAGIQSISFEQGLSKGELDIFTGAFAQMGPQKGAEDLKKILAVKGANNIKINHVTYKKVTEDDQVVAKEALKNITPLTDEEDHESRKKFLDTLLESVLTNEFAETLNITNLISNPGAFSKKLIEIDLAGGNAARRTGRGDSKDTVSMHVDGLGAPGGGGDDAQALTSGGSPGGDSAGSGGTGGPAGSGPGGAGGFGYGGSGGSAGAFGGAGMTGSVGAGTLPLQGGPAGIRSGVEMGQGLSSLEQDAAYDAISAPIGSSHGTLLLHQLELMQQEVKKHLQGQGDFNISDLAHAIFEMKKQLLEGIQAQKALGIAYANEAAIVDNANELADQVLIELVKEEYKAGQITTQRLALIIRRLIPEADELKRLLPKIKNVLLEQGMPLPQYLKLVYELKQELENEALVRILQESSEAIGVDGEDLVEELKRNPEQAAELIYLASEIRKGTGDETALSDILVDYVERLGSKMARDTAADEDDEGGAHLKKVMSDIESNLIKQLGQMNVDSDVLTRMEQRLNERMDAVFDKMRVEWLNAQAGRRKPEQAKPLSVLQTLEQNVTEDEDLEEILSRVREKVEAGEIEENNFSQIHAEILREKQRREARADGNPMPTEVLKSDELMYILEKEIARAKRYGIPFSALAFSFVKAKPTVKALEDLITIDTVLEAACEKLVETFREVDYIGQIGKNKMLVVLPMIDQDMAKKALDRVLRMLHTKPLDVREVPVQLRVAGVAAGFDAEQTPDAQAFARYVSTLLMDMVARVKSIQVLF